MNWLIRLLDWYKQYRLEVIGAKMRADNRQFEILSEITTANTKMLQGWLDSFKTYEVPSSTVIRDEDEYHMEQDRLHPGVKTSIRNAIDAGVFPELKDLLS